MRQAAELIDDDEYENTGEENDPDSRKSRVLAQLLREELQTSYQKRTWWQSTEPYLFGFCAGFLVALLMCMKGWLV
jgi:hypothetical protein